MQNDSSPSRASSSSAPKTEKNKPVKKTHFDLLRSGNNRDRRQHITSSHQTANGSEEKEKDNKPAGNRWTLGILADRKTDEVPGTVVLLSKYSTRNIPLGLQHETTRGRSTSRGSISNEANRRRSISSKKKTPDGQVILDPQPDDSLNDPLNWPAWRRDCALLSLGLYCMIGGGMTPILAAGFGNVAATYNVTFSQVALTTGLYMMGLGVGCVVFSPTAILYGKRPVYLFSSILFVATSIWCAAAPSYAQLATARVFQGIAVSPVECLPSATIAEIYFLHERAFRIGIYTLLLLGGKNLVPLVSAVIIQSLGWRWTFWMVAIILGFCGVLLFIFVPETFWDRAPRPRALRHRSESRLRQSMSRTPRIGTGLQRTASVTSTASPSNLSRRKSHGSVKEEKETAEDQAKVEKYAAGGLDGSGARPAGLHLTDMPQPGSPTVALSTPGNTPQFVKDDPNLPRLHNMNSPYYSDLERGNDYIGHRSPNSENPASPAIEAFPAAPTDLPAVEPIRTHDWGIEKQDGHDDSIRSPGNVDAQSRPTPPALTSYTTGLRHAPQQSFTSTLRIWNGRLSAANWFRVAARPFILYLYPAVLWSSMVYALSVGWLIVLSESVSNIYRNRESYNFSALAVGLVYLSPFIGGILGTAVAGRVSDIIVRFITRKNDGIYEPEFRLVMTIPIALTTAIGLMGFGWSAEERDAWIVPTLFFGIISFGCSLGSTTAITFCVDSYRQFAGEALVTLNFSKNVLHGLVWSLFFPHWLEADGSKNVFLAIGGIQIACLLFTIPMYMYGKRARMWTVRKGMMDKF